MHEVKVTKKHVFLKRTTWEPCVFVPRSQLEHVYKRTAEHYIACTHPSRRVTIGGEERFAVPDGEVTVYRHVVRAVDVMPIAWIARRGKYDHVLDLA